VACDNGNNAKSVCRVKCNVGYALLGNNRFQCAYKGIDLQWTGSMDFKCLKVPCEKTLDLRTGRMSGFTSSQFPAYLQRSYFQQVFPVATDYATVALYPYRNRQDGIWDPWLQSASCNMKAVLAVKRAAPGKKVKVDIWHDNFPSLYHFDVAAHASQSFSFSPDRILGVSGQLLTNVKMQKSTTKNPFTAMNLRSYHSLVQDSSANQIAGFFQPAGHATFIFGDNEVSYSDNRGTHDGTIGPSELLGNVEDGNMVYIGLNRMVNAFYKQGTGACLVCISQV